MSTQLDPRTAARLEEAKRWFRAHHADVVPDAHFATRVAARLRHDPAEDLGRAALRLLPASIALALILAWIAATGPKNVKPAPTTDVDVVQWVYSEAVSSQ